MPVLENRMLRRDETRAPNATMRKGKLVKRATAHELLNTIKLAHY